MQIHLPKKNKKKENYLDELDMVRRESKEKLKNHVGIFSEHRKYDPSILVIFILIMMTAIVVAAALYSVYLLVRISGVSNLAGVHVTPGIKKASQELSSQINGGNNEETKVTPGNEGWQQYENDFFRFMYPGEFELRNNGTISLRKYNDQEIRRFDSLAMSVAFGEIQNPENLPLKEVLQNNRRKLGSKPADAIISGKQALLTGKILLDSGLEAESIYWLQDRRVFYMETVYYDQDTFELEKTNQKIIESIEFL